MQHIKHLSRDRRIKKLISSIPQIELKKGRHLHLDICSSIISQQLSVRVAEVIYGRFLDLFKKKKPSCSEILSVPFAKLRSAGLSNSKAEYVRNVCAFFIENKVTDAKLYKMDDEELITFLTQIKGVGRWTAEMILIFSLGREDVFALDDLGIQQAMTELYEIKAKEKKQMKLDMENISSSWKPYRTYACRYLWAWKNEQQKLKKISGKK